MREKSSKTIEGNNKTENFKHPPEAGVTFAGFTQKNLYTYVFFFFAAKLNNTVLFCYLIIVI